MIDVQEVKVTELNQQQKNQRYFHNIETRHKSGQVYQVLKHMFSDGLSQSYLHCKSVPVVC